jgi:hypothetical protein
MALPRYAETFRDAKETAAHMADHAHHPRQPKAPAREFFIQGITHDGKQFRPSDWAERLCGVMSHFRPEGGKRDRHAHIQYSPYVRPTVLNGIKSVVVNEALRELEPLAYHFVLSFAKDNNLQVIDACLLPDPNDK